MLFGWGRSGGGVLQKWESPYQAIVLSSLMEPPIQNGRTAERFTGASHDLPHIRTNCSPPLQHRALCLARTLPALSLDTNLPLSTSLTLPHRFIFAYRYLWTLFFSSVLFNVTISLLIPSSPLSLSLSHYGFCSHSAECSVLRPEPLVEDNLYWSICKTVPPRGHCAGLSSEMPGGNCPGVQRNFCCVWEGKRETERITKTMPTTEHCNFSCKSHGAGP